jgi:hypothetical protein
MLPAAWKADHLQLHCCQLTEASRGVFHGSGSAQTHNPPLWRPCSPNDRITEALDPDWLLKVS